MLKIGPLTLKHPTILAPMAAHTDLPFRRLIDEIGGAGLLVTEMISAEGLRRRNRRTMEMIKPFPSVTPQFIQLFGSEPAALAEAAHVIENETSYAGIDINMGCPVPKVTRSGAGAGLLKDPERITRMITAVKAAVRLPVTVKVRLGWREVAIGEILAAAATGGADAVMVHFRFASDGYSAPSRWEWADSIRGRFSLPLIGNGDITTPELARERLHLFQGIGIGRGALADPFLFADTTGELVITGRYSRMIHRLCELLEEHVPDRRRLPRLKGHFRFLHFHGKLSRSRKREVFLTDSYSEAKRLILDLVDAVMGNS